MGVVCEAEPAATDAQQEVMLFRVGHQSTGQQQAVGIPGSELQAHREPVWRWSRSWKGHEAAAGAQEGNGHQLRLRARKGHVSLKAEREPSGMSDYTPTGKR